MDLDALVRLFVLQSRAESCPVYLSDQLKCNNNFLTELADLESNKRHAK